MLTGFWSARDRTRGLGIVVASLVGLQACGGAELPVEPPRAAIVDGAHGGNAGFYFLPPLVPQPETEGTFDPSLSPIVRITGTDGLDISLPADLDSSNSHYHANWHTNEYDLDPTVMYRIAVELDGTELGFADVVVGATGSDLKNVDTNEEIPLKDGRTLPIKFRIEEGAGGPPPL